MTKGLLAAFIACGAMQLQAATLQQCEKVKLKQLQAEHGSKAGSKSGKSGGKSGGRGPSKRRQNVDKLEEWLWKNCSSYSYEMRRLEQERM